MTIRVESEIGRLRRVVVQPPGRALSRMLPEHILPHSPDYLLFDDLLDVGNAQREHEQLVRVLETAAEVGKFDSLLKQVFAASEPARTLAIDHVARLEDLTDTDIATLRALAPEALADALIVGTADGSLDGPELFAPIPNLLFSRDLLAVIGNLLMVGMASTRARRRESILTGVLVAHHAWFGRSKVAKLTQRLKQSAIQQALTIEGGDVLVLDRHSVCIGASERTSWASSMQLSREMFARGILRVFVVEMPKRRSSMHLDTVFTQLSASKVAVYKPLVDNRSREQAHVTILHPLPDGGVGAHEGGNLLDALQHGGISFDPVYCGNAHPIHQVREQWTDGANFVALAPGIVIGYARNRHTACALQDAGFESLSAVEYLEMFARDYDSNFDTLLASGRQLAIQIEGSELCRGRGGPRCLTMPLWRD